MGSLLEEYRQRNGISGVWPVNEGTLFFNCNNRPALICITSSHSKAHKTCPACPANRAGITLEIFRCTKSKECYRREAHLHMPPDGDLLYYVERHIKDGAKYVPVIMHTERELEGWAWKFFLETQPFKGAAKTKFQALVDEQQQSKEGNDTAWITQMAWAARKYPEQFRSFYLQVYSLCLINRTYILME